MTVTLVGFLLPACFGAPDDATAEHSSELSSSAADQIADLVSRIDELLADGTLRSGNGNALGASLRAALDSLADGEESQAIDELGAFINKVEALVRSRRLDPAIADELIAAAEAAIYAIEHPPIAAPTIEPSSGAVATPFTITDPKGRMIYGHLIAFAPAGTGPSLGEWVWDEEIAPYPLPFGYTAEFSDDGTTASGYIPPGLGPDLYEVTVHVGEPDVNPQLFESLYFEVR